MPDIICIADTATYTVDKEICVAPHIHEELLDMFEGIDPDGGATAQKQGANHPRRRGATPR